MKEKFENFWYYHKIHVILILLAVIFVSVPLITWLQQPDYDMEISCYTSTPISEDTKRALTVYFKKQGIDVNGDGEVLVSISPRVADIESKNYADKNAEAVLTTLFYELGENKCPMYLTDKIFMEKITSGYREYIREIVCLQEFPELQNKLNLEDDKRIYIIFMNEYITHSDSDLESKYGFIDKIRQSLK